MGAVYSVHVDKIGLDCMAAVLPVGFLGLVDVVVRVTQAGYKALELNAFLDA